MTNGTALPVIYGALPGNDEVMITDYMAYMIIKLNLSSAINNEAGLIGTTLNYFGHLVTISGIMKTDYIKYEILEHKTYTDVGASNYLNDLYWKFIQDVRNYTGLYMNEYTYDNDFPVMFQSISFANEQNITAGYICTPSVSYYESRLIGNSRMPENDHEIVLPFQPYNFNMMSLADFIAHLSDYLGKTVTYSLVTNETVQNPVTYTVVGYVDYSDSNLPFNIMFYEPYFDALAQTPASSYSLILSSDNNVNIRFFKNLDELHLTVNTPVSQTINNLGQVMTIFKTALFIIGDVIMAFTALLIYSFISHSIQLKQKQIGTLRAIGARGLDVSKIFVTESMFMALWSSGLALFGVYGLDALINQSIYRDFSSPLVLVFLDVRQILIIIFIAFFVVFISAFLPIKRITLMRPIKAIKNLK